MEKYLFREPSALHLLGRRPVLKEELLCGDIAISPQDPLYVVADVDGKLAVIAVKIWNGKHHSEKRVLSVDFPVGHVRTLAHSQPYL